MLFNPTVIPPQAPPKFPSGATVTESLLSTTPTVVLSDRGTTQNRRGLSIVNNGTANCILALGTTISATNFTAEILPGGYFEDSHSAPWQGPVVMRSSNSPTTVNTTEKVVII